MKTLGWTARWYAMLAGVLCALPAILVYVRINAGHTAHVGLYNSLCGLALGAIGGLVVWFVGIFRNPAFESVQAALPKSLAILPVVLAPVLLYREAVDPEYSYGCIAAYAKLGNPTA